MKKFVKILLPLLVVFGVLMLLFPRSTKFSYEYRKGEPWKYETLNAQFDFPIIKTGAQMEEERATMVKTVIPYYKYSTQIAEDNISVAENGDWGPLADIRPSIVRSLSELYERGILDEDGVRLEDEDDARAMVFIQKGKRAVEYPASEIYIASQARKKLLEDLSSECPGPELDSLLRSEGVYALITPNLFFDEQTTNLVHSSNDRDISPTMGYVKAGQRIVSNGEMVTAEIEQMLDSYGKEYDSTLGYSRSGIFFWIGNALLALAVLALLCLSIYFTEPGIFNSLSRYLYIIMVFLTVVVPTMLVIRFGNEQYLYLIPYTLAAIYLCSFLGKGVSLTSYSVSLLPMLFYAHSGLVLFATFLVGGAVTVLCHDYLQKGWKQFAMAVIVFVAMFATYSGFRLLDVASGDSLMTVLYLLASCFLCVAGYPFVYLFERIYGLVSNSRLAELADTSNSVLRELEHKAPGTFQHSLQVGNMADFVARTVGANPLLLRVGALYHDIGKLSNPLCFVENESLLNLPESSKYHNSQTAQQSAKDIIRHVEDGIAMAEKHHIPSIVKDFILTHHGTSCVNYFYNKYLNEGGDPAGEADFHYHGIKPQTAEQSILMLCDSVEAASRTLKAHTPEEYDSFVERIVAGKMEEGQFDEAQISLRDLGTVKEALKAYLAQVYHERVTYPKRKNIKVNNK